MDPVLQRAMFQQQQQQQQAVTEADNVKSAQGLQAVAQQMQNVNTEIDNAEDVAGIMNAIRGDNATVEQRRAELAQEVGEADANATPESVLVMLQPTFEMMESLTGQSTNMPMGDAPVETFTAEGTGITSGLMPMPDEGKKKDNFRSEEAIARINAGETPVKARDGMPINSFSVNQNRLNQMFGLTPVNNTLNAQFTDIPPGNTALTNISARPMIADNTQMVDENISNIMGQFNPLIKASTPVADTSKFIADRALLMDPYLTKAYTPQQNLAQLKSLYGDSSGLGVPANLAIAKAGAQIAQGTGTLPEAILGAIPGAATELGQLALLKRKEERDLLAKASELSIKQKQDRNSQLSKFAADSIERADQMKDNYLDNIKDSLKIAVNKGIDVTKADIKTIIDTAVLYSETEKQVLKNQYKYAKEMPDGTFDVKMVYRSANPNKPLLYWDGKQYIPLPDGYKEVDDAFVSNALGANKFDKKNAITKDVTWFSPVTNRYEEGTLFTFPGELGSWIQDPTDGDKWKAKKDVDVATQMVVGKKSDLVTESYDATTGDTYVVDRVLTRKGQGFSRRLQKIDRVANVDDNGEPVMNPDGTFKTITIQPVNVAENKFIRKAPKYEKVSVVDSITGNQKEVFKLSNANQGGSPLAYPVSGIGIPYENLGKNAKSYTKRKLIEHTDFVNSLDEILRQGKVFESAGMANALKRGVLNVIPPLDLTRSKKNFQSFIGEETGKKALELTQRLFVAANTFSEKYPIKEQELLADMFPTGSPFREGKVTLAVLLQLRKAAVNKINRLNSILTNEDTFNIESIPTGFTKNDAIPIDHVNPVIKPDGQTEFTYLNQLIFQKRKGDDLKGLHLNVPKVFIEKTLRDKASRYRSINNNTMADRLELQADKIANRKENRFFLQIGINDYGILDE